MDLNATDIGISVGIVGAMTVVVTQVLKAITGWQDRRALAATTIVALLLSTLGWAATHWTLAQEVWRVIQDWIAGLAAAAGSYGLIRRGQRDTQTQEGQRNGT